MSHDGLEKWRAGAALVTPYDSPALKNEPALDIEPVPLETARSADYITAHARHSF